MFDEGPKIINCSVPGCDWNSHNYGAHKNRDGAFVVYKLADVPPKKDFTTCRRCGEPKSNPIHKIDHDDRHNFMSIHEPPYGQEYLDGCREMDLMDIMGLPPDMAYDWLVGFRRSITWPWTVTRQMTAQDLWGVWGADFINWQAFQAGYRQHEPWKLCARCNKTLSHDVHCFDHPNAHKFEFK